MKNKLLIKYQVNQSKLSASMTEVMRCIIIRGWVERGQTQEAEKAGYKQVHISQLKQLMLADERGLI